MGGLSRILSLVCAGLALTACDGASEATRVELPVVAEGSGLVPTPTDQGYRIALDEARASLEGLTFAVAGEAHAQIWQRVLRALGPAQAQAHPGHYQGGAVSGELPGRFIVSWLPGTSQTIGQATLLSGRYRSANLTFTRATEDDGLEAEDPLLSHSLLLRGQATRDATRVAFEVLLDAPLGREVTGIPFELHVQEGSTETLTLRLLAREPAQGGSLFDGIDFATLDADGDGSLRIDRSVNEPDLQLAYALLRRRLLQHDFYDVKPLSAQP